MTWAEAAQRAVASHVRDLDDGPVHRGLRQRLGSESCGRSERAQRSCCTGDLAAATELGRRSCVLEGIAEEAQRLFRETDFRFLFVPSRKLFSIGYRVRDGSLDPNCYDLLASEARLTSFLAIAKGDVEASHWFRLGRPLTPIGRGSALVSWSGSMFEYLMPALVMRAPWLSLLGHTYRLVVARQIGVRRRPWRALGHLGVGFQRA